MSDVPARYRDVISLLNGRIDYYRSQQSDLDMTINDLQATIKDFEATATAQSNARDQISLLIVNLQEAIVALGGDVQDVGPVVVDVAPPSPSAESDPAP